MCQIKNPDACEVHKSPTSVDLLGSGKISETAEENLSTRSLFSYAPGEAYWSGDFLRMAYFHGRKMQHNRQQLISHVPVPAGKQRIQS